MYPYRIEKERIPVTLRLFGGQSLAGDIFVQPSSYRQLGHESPLDVMNAADAFFPFQRQDGTILLIPKERVAEVRGVTLTPEDEMRRDSARAVEVAVQLLDGSEHPGIILLEMPSDRPRVVDFLNFGRDRFFTLFGDNDIHLINVRAVEFVRPLD